MSHINDDGIYSVRSNDLVRDDEPSGEGMELETQGSSPEDMIRDSSELSYGDAYDTTFFGAEVMTPEIIFSYASRSDGGKGADHMWAVANALRKEGITSYNGLMVTDGNWQEKWYGKMDTAKIAIIMLSDEYWKSTACKEELLTLVKKGKIKKMILRFDVWQLGGHFLGDDEDSVDQAALIKNKLDTNCLPKPDTYPDKPGGMFQDDFAGNMEELVKRIREHQRKMNARHIGIGGMGIGNMANAMGNLVGGGAEMNIRDTYSDFTENFLPPGKRKSRLRHVRRLLYGCFLLVILALCAGIAVDTFALQTHSSPQDVLGMTQPPPAHSDTVAVGTEMAAGTESAQISQLEGELAQQRAALDAEERRVTALETRVDHLESNTQQPTADTCTHPVVVECGTHGSCEGGACICVSGYTGPKCSQAPAVGPLPEPDSAPEPIPGKPSHDCADNGVDDPTGILATMGASCERIVKLGCGTDLHSINPASYTAGSVVSVFCPGSCFCTFHWMAADWTQCPVHVVCVDAAVQIRNVTCVDIGDTPVPAAKCTSTQPLETKECPCGHPYNIVPCDNDCKKVQWTGRISVVAFVVILFFSILSRTRPDSRNSVQQEADPWTFVWIGIMSAPLGVWIGGWSALWSAGDMMAASGWIYVRNFSCCLWFITHAGALGMGLSDDEYEGGMVALWGIAFCSSLVATGFSTYWLHDVRNSDTALVAEEFMSANPTGPDGASNHDITGGSRDWLFWLLPAQACILMLMAFSDTLFVPTVRKRARGERGWCVLGAHCHHVGRAAVVSMAPDSDGDCKVRYDDDNEESSYIKAKRLTPAEPEHKVDDTVSVISTIALLIGRILLAGWPALTAFVSFDGIPFVAWAIIGSMTLSVLWSAVTISKLIPLLGDTDSPKENTAFLMAYAIPFFVVAAYCAYHFDPAVHLASVQHITAQQWNQLYNPADAVAGATAAGPVGPVPDECLSAPCQNDGACVLSDLAATVASGEYQCNCKPDFLGAHCEMPATPKPEPAPEPEPAPASAPAPPLPDPEESFMCEWMNPFDDCQWHFWHWVLWIVAFCFASCVCLICCIVAFDD
jgi:hypothetical protein